MDILGSIMKKMEKPPQMDEKERKLRQQQKEAQKKAQEEKEKRVKAFREQITKRVETFAADETQLRLVFETMEKLQRAILHDIADTAGLLAHSFGTEEVDRHVIVFKPEGMPSEPELVALDEGMNTIQNGNVRETITQKKGVGKKTHRKIICPVQHPPGGEIGGKKFLNTC